MANVDDPVIDTTPADGSGVVEPVISDPRPSIDPERYAQLEDYFARTNPVLKEYEADFKAIIEDEDYRKFSRSSRESYYDMQKRVAAERDAEIPESEKRFMAALDERLGKFKPVLDDYEQRAQTTARTAEEAKTQFVKGEMEYAQRLVAEQKLSAEEVQDLGRFAKVLHDETVAKGEPRFVGLEEVYKRVYGRAETKNAKPVPKSLRGTAGATGVPGASTPPKTRDDVAKPGGLTRHVLGVLNSQRKAG
jgi:hypothetical protein